tara:strand:- start:3193 stop:3951 length:759 start_codon:yes stop_codon:yes gene_type:complete
MENISELRQINPSLVCIECLTRVWNTLSILLSSSELLKLKKHLLNYSNKTPEYIHLVDLTFLLNKHHFINYDDIFRYLSTNSDTNIQILNLGDKYYSEFRTILTRVISYFPDEKYSLFSTRDFIKNECGETFYEMYSLFRSQSPRHSRCCLEKSSNMNNYKAHFELGVINFEKRDYLKAYQYFLKCSEFPISEPLEVCYPPSLNMIGILYDHGWYLSQNKELAQDIFTLSKKMNQRNPDENYDRSQQYKSQL